MEREIQIKFKCGTRNGNDGGPRCSHALLFVDDDGDQGKVSVGRLKAVKRAVVAKPKT